MPVQSIYVVLIRDRGLFLVKPLPGEGQSEAIEAALGLKSGYSVGLAAVELPDGADEVWVAWVEGEGPGGRPYFDYRALPADLTAQEATAQLEAAGETPLRLNRSRIYGEGGRNAAPPPDVPPVQFHP